MRDLVLLYEGQPLATSLTAGPICRVILDYPDECAESFRGAMSELTKAQARYLAVIAHGRPMTPCQMAAYLRTSVAGISRVRTELLAKGFVTPWERFDDMPALTDAGRQALSGAKP